MDARKSIPFLDLITPHLELEEELLQAFKDIIRSASFIGGPIVERFEKDFARFCNAEYCVGVGNGTDALRFALIAAGIGKGDVVVTVPNTFAATVEAIVQTGATAHFVDVDPQTCNMSAESLREYLQTQCEISNSSKSTVHRASGQPVKAILPVHLYGQMCDMDALTLLAEEYGLMVIEDACQAHGSEYFSSKKGTWQRAGSIGKAAAFSFYPGKNLGACGEAGAVTTNDELLAQRIRMIRDHGQNKKYYHLVEGYNGRLDTLQAAMLQAKLPHLDGWNEKRRQAAAFYNEGLRTMDGIKTPHEPSWSRAVYHLYVIQVEQRDELQKYLTRENIGTGLHYPIPLHLQKAYAHLGYHAGSLPIAEKLSGEILSLPMYPQLRSEQQEGVINALKEFCEAGFETAKAQP
jgi:dTDP-4-amino-4,6-dideoxygalactose transaminase